jgi:hypothetical protein
MNGSSYSQLVLISLASKFVQQGKLIVLKCKTAAMQNIMYEEYD